MHAAQSPSLRRRAFLERGAGLMLGATWAGHAGAAAIATPIPPGYVRVAAAADIPAAVLFSVACQESVLRFGNKSLPYPWTLCVRGEPMRFNTQDAAVEKLQACLREGITNVDCGLLQVNWAWNAERLGSPRRALDAYANMGVGAVLLREHYEATKGDWFEAVGRYHHPSDRTRSVPYAAAVFQRLARLPQAGAAPRLRRIVEEGRNA